MDPSRRGLPLRLTDRELGRDRGGARLPPHAFMRDLHGDPSFVRRLKRTMELTGHKGQVPALAWNESGTLLISGGEDARIRIWDAKRSFTALPIEPGHTSTVYAAKFLPSTNDLHIISCSGDRQVRLIDLTKQAVRPFHCHQSRVKALVPIGPNVFLSGSEDGTVCQFDKRERGSCQGCSNAAGSRSRLSGRCGNILVEQHHEARGGRSQLPVGVNCLAVNPTDANVFVTGGLDPLVRLFDRRMLSPRQPQSAPPNPNGVSWVSCFIPPHVYSPRPPFYTSAGRGNTVTGVAFSHTGRELVASYCGDSMYSYSVEDHALEPFASPRLHPASGRHLGQGIQLRPRRCRDASSSAAEKPEEGKQQRGRGGGEGAAARSGAGASASGSPGSSRDPQGSSDQPSTRAQRHQQQQQQRRRGDEASGSGEGLGRAQPLPGTITFDFAAAPAGFFGSGAGGGLGGRLGGAGPTRRGIQTLRMTLPTSAPLGGGSAGGFAGFNMVLPLRPGSSVALSAADLLQPRGVNPARAAQQPAATAARAASDTAARREGQQGAAAEPPGERRGTRGQQGAGASGSGREQGASGSGRAGAAGGSSSRGDSNQRPPKRQRTGRETEAAAAEPSGNAEAAASGAAGGQAGGEGASGGTAPGQRPQQQSGRRRSLIDRLSLSSLFGSGPQSPPASGGDQAAMSSGAPGRTRSTRSTSGQLPSGAVGGAAAEQQTGAAAPGDGGPRQRGARVPQRQDPAGLLASGRAESVRFRFRDLASVAPRRTARFVDLQEGAPREDAGSGPSRGTRSTAVQTSFEREVGALIEGDEGAAEGDANSSQYLQRYEGARHLGATRDVAFMGSRSEFVVSGSDDGNVFIWDFRTGEIVNVLQGEEAAITGVAPHPFDSVLATSRAEDTVQIWSPEAQEAATLENLNFILRRNAQEMMDGDRHRQAPPPVLMNMLQAMGDIENNQNTQAAGGGGSPMRCAIQ